MPGKDVAPAIPQVPGHGVKPASWDAAALPPPPRPPPATASSCPVRRSASPTASPALPAPPAPPLAAPPGTGRAPAPPPPRRGAAPLANVLTTAPWDRATSIVTLGPASSPSIDRRGAVRANRVLGREQDESLARCERRRTVAAARCRRGCRSRGRASRSRVACPRPRCPRPARPAGSATATASVAVVVRDVDAVLRAGVEQPAALRILADAWT